MRIARVDVAPFELDYPGDGYRMSHVHLTRLTHRVMRLVTDTGAVGYSEVARRSAADPEISTRAEDALIAELSRLSVHDIPDCLIRWRAMDDPSDTNRAPLSVAAAVELAFMDLTARQVGLPLSTLLGGPATGALPAYGSLTCDDPETLAEKVRARPHHPVIQAKLGADGGVDRDLERIEACLAALEPGQILLADFNGALDLETAHHAVQQIRDERLVWEDPCRSYDDNAELAHAHGVPMMFDMCMSSVEMFVRAARDGLAHSVVIKPPFVGGLGPARTARDLCAAAGIRMRIDGPWSGPLAAVANLHLALGAPRDLLLCSADLTDPFEESFDMIRHPTPGHVAPGWGVGLGDIPDGLFPDNP